MIENRSPWQAIQNYDGPSEITFFVELMFPIGELVVAFSRIERYITWGIESALKLRIKDADAIQESVLSVPTQIGLFKRFASSHVETRPQEMERLEKIIKALFAANDYRNAILHGPWQGLKMKPSATGGHEVSGFKSKYVKLGEIAKDPVSRLHSPKEIRDKARAMMSTCLELQGWVIDVFPDAVRRVP